MCLRSLDDCLLSGLKGETEEVVAEDEQDHGREGGDPDDRAAGFGEVGVGCPDAAVADPPADAEDGDGVLEEDRADDSEQAQEKGEGDQREGAERTEENAEVAGVATGLGDAGGLGSGGFRGGEVEGRGAEGALLHGGIDGLAAVGAWEDADVGGEAQG